MEKPHPVVKDLSHGALSAPQASGYTLYTNAIVISLKLGANFTWGYATVSVRAQTHRRAKRPLTVPRISGAPKVRAKNVTFTTTASQGRGSQVQQQKQEVEPRRPKR